MSTIIFAFSYQSLSGKLPQHELLSFRNREAEVPYLSPMTRLFRQSFRGVFESARKFDHQEPSVEIDNTKITLKHCVAFSAADRGLEKNEKPDRLLVFVIDIESNSEDTEAVDIWKDNFRNIIPKQNLVREFGFGKLLDCCSTYSDQIVGHTSVDINFPLEGRELTFGAVFAFYALGWLSAIRIERRQLFMELVPVSAMTLKSGRRIADQRVRIIDQQRHFLTEDRTNDLELRRFCSRLAKKYNLPQRFQRSLEIHQAFEHHLDNSAKLHNASQLGSVANLIFILTILSVPIAFFSAIVAIDVKNDIFVNGRELIKDFRIYSAFLVGVLFTLMPLITLRLLDKFRQW